MRASSQYKFLRIHTGRHDLPYFQSPLVEMQLSFFDAFVKGDNHGGWKTGREPPVRFAVRRGTPPLRLLDETSVFKWRSEKEWPPKRAENKTLYLGSDKTLTPSLPSQDGVLSYNGLT